MYNEYELKYWVKFGKGIVLHNFSIKCEIITLIIETTKTQII